MTPTQGLKQRFERFGFWRTAIFLVWWRSSPGLCRKIVSALGRLFARTGRQVMINVNNTRLCIDTLSPWVVREYFILGRYDEKEINAVRAALRGDYAFVDIGANLGAWTFSLADHFSRVWAVEPNPECFTCLSRSQEYHRHANVTLVNAAIADRDGQGKMFASKTYLGDGRIYDPGDGDRQSAMATHLYSFDSFARQMGLEDKAVFLKVDVQGVEPMVFEGMREFLEKARDVVVWTEIQEGQLKAAGKSTQAYLNVLRSKGFVPVDIDRALMPVSWESVHNALARQKDFCFRYRAGHADGGAR